MTAMLPFLTEVGLLISGEGILDPLGLATRATALLSTSSRGFGRAWPVRSSSPPLQCPPAPSGTSFQRVSDVLPRAVYGAYANLLY